MRSINLVRAPNMDELPIPVYRGGETHVNASLTTASTKWLTLTAGIWKFTAYKRVMFRFDATSGTAVALTSAHGVINPGFPMYIEVPAGFLAVARVNAIPTYVAGVRIGG